MVLKPLQTPRPFLPRAHPDVFKNSGPILKRRLAYEEQQGEKMAYEDEIDGLRSFSCTAVRRGRLCVCFA